MVFTHDFTDEQNSMPLGQIDLTACERLQEDRETCWQALVHTLMQQLTTSQHTLDQAIARCKQLETERGQLLESLEESEAQNRALMEASTAQARQFSATLQHLRQNQAQIVQNEKMASLGQLVAGVAHEINNPVNFIYGNLSHVQTYAQNLLTVVRLYQQHYPHPPAELQDVVEDIDLPFLQNDLPKILFSMQLGTDRIRNIVLSLRNFSRMDEAGAKAVDLHEGIESTLLILQHRFATKAEHPGIALVRDYGKLPKVECYAGQINQVFMNILANAIDALEEKLANAQRGVSSSQIATPQIQIRTVALDTNRVQIAIADNGSGMPESIRQQIFDPFFTTKPIGKGTGLGMSISYQIITEKHNGTLECFSVHGQGTEFVIELPVRQP